MSLHKRIFTILCLAALSVAAQRPRGDGPPGQPPPPPPAHDIRLGPPGMWWNDAELAKKLNISSEQQKKMGDIFQQNRTRLIDLSASVQKEEAVLEPLVQADQADDAKILSQIDRVAQARAELEKGRAKMLLGIRHVLTPDQWKQLLAQDLRPPRRDDRDGGPPPPRRPQDE